MRLLTILTLIALIPALSSCAVADGVIGGKDTSFKDELKIVSTNPAQGTSRITSSLETISIEFDREIDANEMKPFVLLSAQGAPSPNFALTASGNTLILTFDGSDLREFETLYTVTIKKGATSVDDAGLNENFSFNFTTAVVFEDHSYTLHNAFLKRLVVLTANRDKPVRMEALKNDRDEQLWRFTELESGYYQMTTLDAPNQSMEGGDGTDTAFLGDYGQFTGQQWTFVLNGPAEWKLQNLNHQERRSLEGGNGVNDPLQPYMSITQNVTGQLWTLTRTPPVN